MGIPFVLDVAIGLVFIYLILSLLASELQELLTTLFQWRAKHLRDAIEVFLAGGSSTPEEEEVRALVSDLYDDPLLKNINQESKSLVAKGARSVTRWLIPGNRKGAFGTQQSSGPSYIAPETFSTSLIERLGMSTLARKLTEVRLEKFAVRIVGGFKVQEGEAPWGDWDRGRIRLIAEKAKKDLSSDANFATLVEEYADILHDFTVEATTLETCVERMGESLDAYIANYPLPNAQAAAPIAISTVAAETPQSVNPQSVNPQSIDPQSGYPQSVNPQSINPQSGYSQSADSQSIDPQSVNPQSVNPQSIDPQSADPQSIDSQSGYPQSAAPQGIDATGSQPGAPEPLADTTNSDNTLYFAKRLRALKLSLFGADNERAVLSGGLRPSLSEIAQLVDESSTTYQEVAQSYKTLLEKAVPLEAQVNPELERQLLDAYPEAIEKELVQAYPETVEEQLLAIAPDTFRTVEKQLTARRRKTYRARLHPQINLLKQQKRTLHKALGQLSGEQRQQILSAVINQFGGDERTLIINKSLEELSNEQRYAIINLVFVRLGLTNTDRSTYDDYQTYKTIRQALEKLPNSIKESFAILARRAQSKVQQVSHDVNQFRQEVEVWFDRSMDRASGVYKRNAKGVAILIGLVLAGVTNSDSFFIVNRLSNDENLRKVITDRASQVNLTKDPSAPVTNQNLLELKQETDKALNDLSLPVGWKPENLTKQFECELPNATKSPNGNQAGTAACNEVFFPAKEGTFNVPAVFQLIAAKPIDLLKLLIGWIVSGLAIAMGAPFWFDLLGKIMNVRNSGSKPQTASTKETAK